MAKKASYKYNLYTFQLLQKCDQIYRNPACWCIFQVPSFLFVFFVVSALPVRHWRAKQTLDAEPIQGVYHEPWNISKNYLDIAKGMVHQSFSSIEAKNFQSNSPMKW